MSNLLLIHRNLWWKMMSHADRTAINFHTVSHAGTQCYDPCVSCIANYHGFNGAYCDCNCFTSDAQGIDGGIKFWRIFQYWVWTNGQRWWWTDRPGMIWWRSQKPIVCCTMKKELFYFICNNVKLWVCKFIYFLCSLLIGYVCTVFVV